MGPPFCPSERAEGFSASERSAPGDVVKQMLASALAVRDRNEERRGEEDRRVRPGDESHEERQDEAVNGGPAEEEEREENDDDGERRVERPYVRLLQALPDRHVEGFSDAARLISPQVLADAVEHDDRVIDRESEDREERDDEERIRLESDGSPEDGEHPRRNDDVVEERENRDQPVHPRGDGVRHLTERKRDVQNDHEHDEENGEHGLLPELGAHRGPHRAQALERNPVAVACKRFEETIRVTLCDRLRAHEERVRFRLSDRNAGETHTIELPSNLGCSRNVTFVRDECERTAGEINARADTPDAYERKRNDNEER